MISFRECNRLEHIGFANFFILLTVLVSVGHEIGDVLLKCSTQCDIENLQPTANTEERHVPSNCCMHNRKLEPVSLRVRPFSLLMPLLTELFWIDIPTARDDHGVESIKQG